MRYPAIGALLAAFVLTIYPLRAHAQTPATPPQTASEPKAEYPSGTFSGLMFGDYYWYFDYHQDQIGNADPTSVEGQSGFWFRRIYLTYDYAYSEKLRMRFRLEANSDGQFSGGNLEPYVKDAYLRWNFTGQQQLTLGMQPTLTFDWLEELWGLRHIEKTPADLYRIDSSRDFGVALSGTTGVEGLRYAVQFGNESGNGSENEEGKIVRLQGRFARAPLTFEGFYSFATRPGDQDRTTAQGIAGFQNNVGRLGGQYLWQKRKSGATPDDDVVVDDQTIDIWSVFGVWDVLPKKVDLFLRVDGVSGHLGDVETGLPGADRIDYWLLSPESKFTTWILGGEWFLHPQVRISPNLGLVRYATDPDPVNFPGRSQDAILKLTFFWTF